MYDIKLTNKFSNGALCLSFSALCNQEYQVDRAKLYPDPQSWKWWLGRVPPPSICSCISCARTAHIRFPTNKKHNSASFRSHQSSLSKNKAFHHFSKFSYSLTSIPPFDSLQYTSHTPFLEIKYLFTAVTPCLFKIKTILNGHNKHGLP